MIPQSLPVHIHSFDLTPMLTGYQVHGTVWQRDDVDSSWTAEAALSWQGLSQIPGRFRTPPRSGDAWRLGFSRVEAPRPPYWQADWTWPTHGEYNMHIGQRDGYVQFTTVELGAQQADPQPIPRLFAAGRQWQTVFQLHEGVQSLLVDDGTLWGISRANIWHWGSDGEVLGFYQADDGIPRHARILAQDGRGRVWAAGERGIACFEDDAWHGLTGLQGFPLRGFERLWAGSDGDMWIASRAGLYRFSTRAESVWLAADGYQPGHVRDLLVDGRGAAWVVGDSLVYRVGADGRRVLGKQDGLPSSRLTALAMDKAGNVWIAGIPTGRSYFDGRSLSTFRD